MAKEDIKPSEGKTPEKKAAPTTKRVSNRKDYKIELVFNGGVIIFPPRKTVEVPINFCVPKNLGLYEV